jgi:hypothetical protein
LKLADRWAGITDKLDDAVVKWLDGKFVPARAAYQNAIKDTKKFQLWYESNRAEILDAFVDELARFGLSEGKARWIVDQTLSQFEAMWREAFNELQADSPILAAVPAFYDKVVNFRFCGAFWEPVLYYRLSVESEEGRLIEVPHPVLTFDQEFNPSS